MHRVRQPRTLVVLGLNAEMGMGCGSRRASLGPLGFFSRNSSGFSQVVSRRAVSRDPHRLGVLSPAQAATSTSVARVARRAHTAAQSRAPRQRNGVRRTGHASIDVHASGACGVLILEGWKGGSVACSNHAQEVWQEARGSFPAGAPATNGSSSAGAARHGGKPREDCRG